MCGIIGYVGRGNAAETVYEGLLKLEYRGYDSAGIAVLSDGRCQIIKSAGRVEKLNTAAQKLGGTVGIGHTRWATHGKPDNVNAHPHRAGKITVVHNGEIENYAELKAGLISGGEKFLSETDSEVIPRLINKFYEDDLLAAVVKCAGMLKGSYALLAICDGREEIVAAKFRSPIILGLGDGCNFCASDEPALAGKCANVCVLEDGDFAVVTKNSVQIYDGELNKITRAAVPNRAEEQSLFLGGYPHYMIKELWEAPAAVKNTLTAFGGSEDGVRAALGNAREIIFTGCGTAYHAALLGKRYFAEIAKLSAVAEYAGELRYSPVRPCAGTALIAVTQSGETADTVEAARLYKNAGATVIAVTNCPHSAISRIADLVVPVCAGPEICVAATKSYSAQIAALLAMALALSEDGKYSDVPGSAPALISETLQNIDIYALAEMCARSSGVYFMGRGADYAVALEGSLKLKEVSYIPGGGYPSSELKHGTLALIDGSTLSAFIITDEALAAKSMDGVEQALSRGGMVAVITNLPEVRAQFSKRAEVIMLPGCPKYTAPLAAAAALQLLAYRVAVILGRDPDKPRNLAKSVTVE